MPRKRKLEGPVSNISDREWDPTLKQGDFVCLAADGNVPNIYEVREFWPRILMDHELFNNPSLLARGCKPGDELPPLLVLRKVRDAPAYRETPARHTIERKVDAHKVVKVTLEQIEFVTNNLNTLAAQIRERNPDADSLFKG